MKNLYRYPATLDFLLSYYYEGDLDTLEQLFRYLITPNLFPSNLRAVLIILKQLYMYLASIPSFLSNLGGSEMMI